MDTEIMRSFEYETPGQIWYLGYGSNMQSSVMAKRGLTVLRTANVVVDSHILNFDVFGVPFSEPAMAGISERPIDYQGPALHGIIYLLSEADYQRLIVSEGAGVAYREVTFEVRVLSIFDAQKLASKRGAAGDLLIVHTLVPRYPFRPNALPSTRYLNLLISGAEDRKLPQEYLEYLRSLPHFTKATAPVAKFSAQIFLSFWMPYLSKLMRHVKSRADEKGQVPDWMGTLVNLSFRCMWWYHDYIHSIIWRCDGGRIPRAILV